MCWLDRIKGALISDIYIYVLYRLRYWGNSNTHLDIEIKFIVLNIFIISDTSTVTRKIILLVNIIIIVIWNLAFICKLRLIFWLFWLTHTHMEFSICICIYRASEGWFHTCVIGSIQCFVSQLMFSIIKSALN